MSRGPTTFRQRDAQALIKAATAAGLAVVRIELDRAGRIVVVTAKADAEACDTSAGKNEWDGAV